MELSFRLLQGQTLPVAYVYKNYLVKHLDLFLKTAHTTIFEIFWSQRHNLYKAFSKCRKLEIFRCRSHYMFNNDIILQEKKKLIANNERFLFGKIINQCTNAKKIIKNKIHEDLGKLIVNC